MGDFASFIIAFAGLFAAIFVLPFVVNRALAKRDTRDSILVEDLNEIYNRLHQLDDKYKAFLESGKPLKVGERISYIREVTILSNLIANLSTELSEEHADLNFNEDVKDVYNVETYRVITENLKVGSKVKETEYVAASNSIQRLTNTVKKCRYKTYKS